VRDELERQVIHARVTGVRPVGEPRQLAAVALGKVPPRRADLLLNEVEIIEQRLGRRRDAAVVTDGMHDEVVGVEEYLLVLLQSSIERIRAFVRFEDLVPPGEPLTVALELLGAEQLGAQRAARQPRGDSTATCSPPHPG
jgi:hypothetical protein